MDTKRWKAVVAYRGEDAPQTYRFEELRELHDLIEAGPNFGDIESIVVTYQYHIQVSWKTEAA